MTKIAYDCASIEELRGWVEAGPEARMTTRYLPRRHEEMVGGSLFWIMEHTIVARCEILGFAQGPDGRCIIRLAPKLVSVEPRPKRAHQGWRYLEDEDAPRDLTADEAAGQALPRRLLGKLSQLGLV